MSETFIVGDVVRLKSGSPKMVITATYPTQAEHVKVAWCIYDKHTMEYATLPIQVLTKSL